VSATRARRVPPRSAEVEEIPDWECRKLLGSERVGRLGVVVGGRPEIFPVNYSLDETGAVVFETGPGTKLAGAVNDRVVFEIDHPTERGGWSVVVHGVAQHTTAASLRFPGPAHASWVGGRPYTLRIHPSRISGRRLVRPS
jgi:uncharacterized protein